MKQGKKSLLGLCLLSLLPAFAHVLRCCGEAVGPGSGLPWPEKLGFALHHSGAADWFRWLCDGFTIPAVFLLSAWALIWLTGSGTKKLLGYWLRTLLGLFLPSEKAAAESARQEKRQGRMLLISGTVSMGAALLFLCLYLAVS